MKRITIALILSTASLLLDNPFEAEAMTFKCLNRTTGEQVAESAIDTPLRLSAVFQPMAATL